MSDKFDKFEEALKELCIKHDVYLYESYDGVVVTDLEGGVAGLSVYLIDGTKD